MLPQTTLDAIARNKITLKGPLTTPVGEGFTSINVTLRKKFNLYSNVRPVISFKGTKARYENIRHHHSAVKILKVCTQALAKSLKTKASWLRR